MSYYALKLFMWLMVCYGTTQLIVLSVIFESPRNYLRSKSGILDSLLGCMLCTGTWVSAIYSFLLWSPSSIVFDFDVLYYKIGGIGDNVVGLFRHIIFGVLDAIVGGALIWFLYLIDNKLSK